MKKALRLENKYRLKALLICFLIGLKAISQTQPVFQKLDQANGLSNGRVTCIVKEERGFVWIGTKDGLNRFDGFEFKVYNKKNSNIGSNDISDILIDTKGRLWISTLGGGLNLYDRFTDTFKVYRNIQDDSTSIASNQVNTIFEDSHGKLWLGTENGLSKFDDEENMFKSFTFISDSLNSSSYNSIRSICEGSDGNLWVGTFGGGINKFDIQNQNFVQFPADNNFFTDFVHVVYPLKNNEILIGTSGGGLVKINEINHKFSKFFEGPLKQKYDINIVRTIHKDSKGNLWIGTDGKGVLKITNMYSTKPSVHNFLYNSQIKSSLSGNAVYEIIEDDNFNIWIGTAWNGVNILNQTSKYDFLYSDIKGIDPSPVLSIYQADDKLLLGLDGNGLTVFNNKYEGTTYYNKENKKFIGGDYIQFISRSHDKKFWLATFANGLINFNSETGKYKQFKHDSKNNKSLSYNDVRYVLEDEHKNLWVATWGGGLNYLNTKKEEFKSFRENKNSANSINSDNVISLQKDERGNLWIATFGGGINFFDPVTEKFQHFVHDENNPNSISGNNIFSILLDSKNNLWIGTSGEGLNRLDIENNKIERFSNNDQIKYGTITAIVEDNNGIIWFSTKQGIINYNYETGKFNNYPELSGEFHINSAFKDQNGYLYFGGTTGVIKFNPKTITVDSTQPEVTLTSFKLFNKEVEIGKDKILSKPVSLQDHITLAHDDDVITFEFAALQFPFASGCEYSIKMENFDEDWRYIGKDRTATYTNLPPGKYEFKVRSKNSGNDWGQNYTSVKITILKPFWLKWWAILFYIFFFVITIYLFIKYIIAWEQIKSKLRLEQLTHEKDTELHKLKQQFFTNISHEIRTPVTLILGAISRLFESESIVEKQHYNAVSTIKKSSNHLLRLTNELLDFRKLETDEIKLKITQNNWVDFCNEIFLSFNEVALKNNIQYTFNVQQENILLWFDKSQLEKVIYNLLSNAFKFTGENGKITLNVYCNEESAFLEVEDTGVGISKKQVSNIFNRFYQTQSPEEVKEIGFGLGLSISKEIMKRHHGNIFVNSEENVGSKFTISLKHNNKHFKPAEIVYDYKDEEEISRYVFNSAEEKSLTLNHSLSHINIKNQRDSTVLIVEDNIEIQNLLGDLLCKDFNILQAPNGKEALTIANDNIPDLIISDVMMPVMDGITLTNKLKLNPVTSHIPVILLTARTSYIHKQEGYETGADDYITKPFNHALLKTRVKNILRNRQLLREKFNTEALTKPADLAINKVDQAFLEKLMKIIEENIDKNDLNAKFLTKELGMSHSVIYKKIKSLTGLTFLDFVRDFKLKRARQLIEKYNYSVSDACYKVGYSDRKYFSRLFKQKFGKNPSDFAKGNSQ
ncbi:two-component regulator propeller domain-containing protein [Abyssalbus ytuae]|uniref:histidine kinase n=1 Tax=Abyssalbus ytuae TaxID=2926907 RepID=A0A9E6ZVP5_9FLAO|nr:two-component regulator propeller domain-containing protein [Abyssalbus ytuae]UOB18643.1 response regulator [Abyssalbus ytuae]